MIFIWGVVNNYNCLVVIAYSVVNAFKLQKRKPMSFSGFLFCNLNALLFYYVSGGPGENASVAPPLSGPHVIVSYVHV